MDIFWGSLLILTIFMDYFYNQLLLFVFCYEIYANAHQSHLLLNMMVKVHNRNIFLGFAKISSIFGVCSKYLMFFWGVACQTRYFWGYRANAGPSLCSRKVRIPPLGYQGPVILINIFVTM